MVDLPFKSVQFQPDQIVERGSEWLSRLAGIGGFILGIVGLFLFLFA